MNINDIKELIINSIKNCYQTNNIIENVDEQTELIGNNSLLDSLKLVTVIVDIESQFNDKNYEVSLTSEKAMSFMNSPFKNVLTMASFIFEQINGSK